MTTVKGRIFIHRAFCHPAAWTGSFLFHPSKTDHPELQTPSAQIKEVARAASRAGVPPESPNAQRPRYQARGTPAHSTAHRAKSRTPRAKYPVSPSRERWSGESSFVLKTPHDSKDGDPLLHKTCPFFCPHLHAKIPDIGGFCKTSIYEGVPCVPLVPCVPPVTPSLQRDKRDRRERRDDCGSTGFCKSLIVLA